ncbi:MAG: L-dopachrome tautomerase-related protein, partial [Phycisphaeraceae bacterium]
MNMLNPTARSAYSRLKLLVAFALASLTILAAVGCATRHQSPTGFAPQWDKLVVEVARFDQNQPSSVAVSKDGRLFVGFPWWSHRPDHAVVEVLPDGSTVPYPSNSWNNWNGKGGPSALMGFVCAQAMYVDDTNHLWVLDAGNPRNRSGVVTAGPKIFKINLDDDSIAQIFYIDHKRSLSKDAYLSDFRVDPEHSVAYIADAGRGGIFVYDLKTRESHTALLDHDSTKADISVIPRVGSAQWRGLFGITNRVHVSSVELSNDGQWLYFHALTARDLYRVPTDRLRDPSAPTTSMASAVERVGSFGSTIDGMHMADDGSLYAAAIEDDAILVRRPDGEVETFVADQRMQWPDSMVMGEDGYLYFTTSMRHLHFPHRARPMTGQPYQVLKVSVDKVELAVAKRAAWEEARRTARAAREQAEAAQRRSAQREAEAVAQRRLAEREHEAAEAVKKRAVAAERVKQAAVSDSQTRAEKLDEASEKAAAAADAADEKAAQAAEAAEEAKIAAEIARKKAEAAAATARETQAAKQQMQMTAAEAEVARLAHERAMEAVKKAEARAEAAFDMAADRVAEARRMAEAADRARELAEKTAAQAKAAQLASQNAQRRAELAAAAAKAAEFA